MKTNKATPPVNANRVILINGVGWIGACIAQFLEDLNSQLILVDKCPKMLDECRLKLEHKTALFICADLSIEKAAIDLMNNIKKNYNKLDAVIHTASIYPRNVITEISVDEWSSVLHSNLTSAFLVIKHAVALMRPNHWGRILLFSSTTGVDFGVPGFAHYATTKAGIEGLTKSAAVELAQYGITVNSLCPGNIINEPLYKITAAEKQAMIEGIPIKRIGRPADVANIVKFLLEPATDFITGQSFRIDGGETLMPKADFVDLK